MTHLQGQDKYNKAMFQNGEQADVAGVYIEYLKTNGLFSPEQPHGSVAWIHSMTIHVLGKPNAWNKT